MVGEYPEGVWRVFVRGGLFRGPVEGVKIKKSEMSAQLYTGRCYHVE